MRTAKTTCRPAHLSFFSAVALVGLTACAGTGATAKPCASPPAGEPQEAPACAIPTGPMSTEAPSAPTRASGRAAGYDQPAQPLLDVLHAPAPATPYLSPTGDNLLLIAMEEYAPMSRIAEPILKLAGIRLEPRTRRKHDTPGGYGVTACAHAISVVNVATGAEVHLALPPDGCVDSPAWSADGKRFLLHNTGADAVELWVGDAARGEIHRVPGVRLNPLLGGSAAWMPDQKTLLVKLVPDDAGPAPAASIATDGPNVQESNGKKGQSSTYEARDTLASKHDEDLFDYYATSQLAFVDSESGRVTKIGKPAIPADVDASPDGAHLFVESIHKPYSYVTAYTRFPREIEVWDPSGAVAKVLASRPLQDRVPIHGEPTGPRDYEWRANEPATLIWAEALDRGDWNVKVPARDKVMMQRAPFSTPPVEIARTEQRFEGISWGETPGFALLREYDENRHWTRTFTFNPDDPQAKPKLLFDRSSDDHYGDPGAPVMRALPNGAYVIRQTGGAIYLRGMGSSPDGDRPFLDRFEVATKKAERLFRSDKTAYERVVGFTDPGGTSFLTWHESPTDPPNAFVRTVGPAEAHVTPGEPAFTSTSRALTRLPDPTPLVRAIKKRLVKYKRKDGMELSFKLYTPPGYQEGTRVPAILYAYPLDYADASKAGQVTGSEQTFTRLRNYRLLLLAGYAIIDDAAFPIVGDPKKAYDHYLDQLVMDATAAVDKAVEIGVVDPDRIGVTGHSHGALMTVNLLAHTDLFRAGVASSGSYNKTLTPFGFQSERRSVWDALSVYLQASPFFSADKLKLPILLVHGAEDANPGTTPPQSQRLFEAIRGNGGTARLVMLPHEPHWYSAMESNEQFIYEMARWFDTYVKNAPPRDRAAPAGKLSGKRAK